jgi:excinuclease ABC subunit C
VSDVFDAKAFLKTSQPGVYRMYDAGGTVIYVGKAKDLKKRLSSYFRSNLASRKTEALVALIAQIDVTVTHTETEALLLEHNYIKLYQPRYNVLLRDDPILYFPQRRYPSASGDASWRQTCEGRVFWSFPNGYAVRETLALLQKIFPIRQCENSVYRNRSRPCLQYQIGRCLGPCVAGLVSEEEYAQQVEYVRLFLAGKDDQVLTQLIARMEKASQALEFEEAARIRDQIQAVRRVTENSLSLIPVTILTLSASPLMPAWPASTCCLSARAKCWQPQLFPESAGRYRAGRGGGNLCRPVLSAGQPDALPGEILLDFNLGDKTLLADSLSELAGRRVNVQTKPRGDRARYLKLARTNAATALTTNCLSSRPFISVCRRWPPCWSCRP